MSHLIDYGNRHKNNTISKDSEDGEHMKRSKIREKLGTMSFEELLRMKEKMGSKLYNRMFRDGNKTKKLTNIKRANKNRPQEISSKIKPKIFQRNLSVKKERHNSIQFRDPRFDSLCGEFDKDKFKDDYKFIYDIQEKEKKILKEEEKLEQDVERKKSIKSAIQRLVSNSKLVLVILLTQIFLAQ